MENRMLKTSNLKLARLKYFDTKHNGVELNPFEVFAFLEKIGEDTYVNVFRPEETLPVYDRAPYSNVTKSGLEYGTKIFLVTGESKDGPCYVIESRNVPELLSKDLISMNDLKDFVISSPAFFMDRDYLIRRERGKKLVSLMPLLMRDLKRKDAFNQYLDSHEKPKQYTNRNS